MSDKKVQLHPFLCTREECFYQEPFILSYYRKRLTVSQCLQSLFLLHNETANVWTEILGIIICCFFVIYGLTVVIPPITTDIVQQSIFAFYLYSIIQCFFVSGVAHLFCCYSPLVRARLFQADYCCIFTSGFGVHLANAYFSPTFHHFCWKTSAAAFILCLTTSIYLVIEREKQLQKEFKRIDLAGGRGPLIRSLLFFVVMNFVYLPIYEYAYNSDNLSDALLALAIPASYITGGIFYGFFIPQRFAPGKFDLLPGQSIMHVMMIIGQCFQFFYVQKQILAFNAPQS